MKSLWCMVIGLLLFTAGTTQGKVLSERRVRVSEVHVFLSPTPPTAPQYVMTHFTPGNIRFLERMDIVVDGGGEVAGVVLVYTPGDGFRRSVFLKGVKGWAFKRPNMGSLYKEVVVRVVTTEELNNL